MWQNHKHIEFELDNYVEFKNREKQKFIYCLNENPFINCRKGDKIEIDLNITKGMNSNVLISGKQGIVFKSYIGNSYDYYNLEQGVREGISEKPKVGRVSTQASVTLYAYESQATYDFLYDALEWLELYVEKANYYPNWQQKKQLPKTITRPDIPYLGAKEIKGHFSSTLTGLRTITNDKPQFLLEKLQNEFFSWLDNSGINVNNCPAELKQSLIDFHSILIGKGEDFTKRRRKETDEEIDRMTTEERKKNFYDLITAYQEPLENQDEVFEAMKDQTYKDAESENRFSGDVDREKEIFEQIKTSGNFMVERQRTFSTNQPSSPQQTGQIMDNGNFAMIGDEVYLPVNNRNEVDTGQLNTIQQDLRLINNVVLNTPTIIGNGIAVVTTLGGLFGREVQKRYFKKSLS
ncbi:MAG: hypothetical protein MRERC_9c011 [Mycoplasmataceae bacterium RC_NB112A]|nr:MAG: hypothetical protein MRERC_9c011 [Mycoplasmataceae bacterium RC_NB112A]